tara:strand:+ start:239 stop:649 length:411 start_codon:yes stop_codon:yes gene_type:complete
MSRAKNLANFQTTITDGTTSVATSFVTNGSSKAWTKFDGSAVTSDLTGVLASFGVASVVDNTTGDFTVNVSSAFSTAHYSVASTNGVIANNGGIFSVAENAAASPTASAYRLNVCSPGGTQNDNTSIKLTFDGDLA